MAVVVVVVIVVADSAASAAAGSSVVDAVVVADVVAAAAAVTGNGRKARPGLCHDAERAGERTLASCINNQQYITALEVAWAAGSVTVTLAGLE